MILNDILLCAGLLMYLDSSNIEKFCFVDLQWLCNVLMHVVSFEDDCKSQIITIMYNACILHL